MQKFIPILFILQITHHGLCAQKLLSLQIVDDKKNPVPYASIAFIYPDKGTIADQNGRFTLSFSNEQDSIKISAISYLPRIVALKDLIRKDTVILIRESATLEEVVVFLESKRTENKFLGFYYDKNNASFILRPGAQLALFIPNTGQLRGNVNKIFFRLEKLSKCNIALRVRLLKPTLNNFPGEDLLKQNLILKSKELQKNNILNVSEYSIPFPQNGIYLVLEWIDVLQSCKSPTTPVITGTLKSNINSVWFNYRDRKWTKRPNTPVKDDKFMTPAAGIQVSY